jgi:hypothetical protein
LNHSASPCVRNFWDRSCELFAGLEPQSSLSLPPE